MVSQYSLQHVNCWKSRSGVTVFSATREVPWNLFSVVYNFGSYYIACLFLCSKKKKKEREREREKKRIEKSPSSDVFQAYLEPQIYNELPVPLN